MLYPLSYEDFMEDDIISVNLFQPLQVVWPPQRDLAEGHPLHSCFACFAGAKTGKTKEKVYWGDPKPQQRAAALCTPASLYVYGSPPIYKLPVCCQLLDVPPKRICSIEWESSMISMLARLL